MPVIVGPAGQDVPPEAHVSAGLAVQEVPTESEIERENKLEENVLQKELREAQEENGRLKQTMEEKGKDPHVKTVVDEVLEPLAMSVFGVESTVRNLRLG